MQRGNFFFSGAAINFVTTYSASFFLTLQSGAPLRSFKISTVNSVVVVSNASPAQQTVPGIIAFRGVQAPLLTNNDNIWIASGKNFSCSSFVWSPPYRLEVGVNISDIQAGLVPTSILLFLDIDFDY